LVSVDCCFFAFFGVFSGDFGFLYSRSIPDLLLFLNYFLSVSQWALFSYASPWLRILVTLLATTTDQSKVVLQIRAMCRASSIILQLNHSCFLGD